MRKDRLSFKLINNYYRIGIKMNRIIRILIIDFCYSYCYNVYNLFGNEPLGGLNEKNGIVNTGG